MDIMYTTCKPTLKSDWEMTTTHSQISKDQDSGSIKHQKQINHQVMMETKKEEPEAPEKPCVLRDGFKPWPMCPQGPLPVNGMNGDIVNKVKDGPFLDRPKNATKAASGKKAAETSP